MGQKPVPPVNINQSPLKLVLKWVVHLPQNGPSGFDPAILRYSTGLRLYLWRQRHQHPRPYPEQGFSKANGQRKSVILTTQNPNQGQSQVPTRPQIIAHRPSLQTVRPI